jgi:uncharacterized protein
LINYLKDEIRKLNKEARSLDFQTVYIFLSVAVIIFISLTFASPSFYYDHFGSNRLDSRIYWFLTDGLLMFFIPVLSIKLVFKKKLSDFGITTGDKKFGLITSALFFAVMFVVVWIVSASEEFALAYPQGGSLLKNDTGMFIFYEFCILIYMLGWEFLWRGYMLFGLERKLGYYTIFIQMIPFFILHKGKPDIELFASIFAGIILGIQALRSRSFLYSWILHWMVMLSIDTISVLRFKYNFYSLF